MCGYVQARVRVVGGIHDILVKDILVRVTLVMDISVTGLFGNRTFR